MTILLVTCRPWFAVNCHFDCRRQPARRGKAPWFIRPYQEFFLDVQCPGQLFRVGRLFIETWLILFSLFYQCHLLVQVCFGRIWVNLSLDWNHLLCSHLQGHFERLQVICLRLLAFTVPIIQAPASSSLIPPTVAAFVASTTVPYPRWPSWRKSSCSFTYWINFGPERDAVIMPRSCACRLSPSQ